MKGSENDKKTETDMIPEPNLLYIFLSASLIAFLAWLKATWYRTAKRAVFLQSQTLRLSTKSRFLPEALSVFLETLANEMEYESGTEI